MFFHWYGFFIGLGVLAASFVVEKIQKELIKKDKYFGEIKLETLTYYVFGLGVIGARIYHLIDYWDYYRQNLVKIFFVWEGGLAIYGAILGGILGIWIYVKMNFGNKWKDYFWKILNMVSLGLPVAQAIGRIGNFFNQELFGLPTNLPWGIFIDFENRPITFINMERFHPLFLYEGILNLGLFLILFYMFKKKKEKGSYFCYYLIGYGLIRFILDYLRIDPWKIGIFSTAQWISIFFIVLGGIQWYFGKSKADK